MKESSSSNTLGQAILLALGINASEVASLRIERTDGHAVLTVVPAAPQSVAGDVAGDLRRYRLVPVEDAKG